MYYNIYSIFIPFLFDFNCAVAVCVTYKCMIWTGIACYDYIFPNSFGLALVPIIRCISVLNYFIF